METLVIIVSMLILVVFILLNMPTKQTKNTNLRNNKNSDKVENAKAYFHKLKRIEGKMVSS